MKKCISCLVLIMMSLMCASVSYASGISGSCGEDATFTLVNNVLTISGTGIVDDSIGWEDYSDTTKEIIVGEGITELDQYVFSYHSAVTNVKLPETLEYIGRYAFRGCESLEKLVIPNNVTEIVNTAFRNCDNLTLYCSEGSYAEEFAIDNDIPYVILKDIKISFDANGGNNAPSELTGTVTDAITIPSLRPNKKGATFIGWSDTNTATEVKYKIGDIVNFSEDTTLYAVWLECVILDKSTESVISVESNVDTPSLTLYIAAYSEQSLAKVDVIDVTLNKGENTIISDYNWDSIEKDLIKIMLWTDELVPVAEAKEIKVINNKYTVNYIDADGTVLSTQTILEGSDATAPSSPTMSGMTFCGWSSSGENITCNTDIVAQYVDASKDNVFKVSNVQGNVGDIVTTSIYLDGIVKTCGFDMRLNYDSDVLEFVSTNADWNLDIVAHHVENESLIKFNYGSSKNRTKKAKVIEVSFRIKDTTVSETTLGIQQVEVIAADETNNDEPTKVNHTLIDGVVKIK